MRTSFVLASVLGVAAVVGGAKATQTADSLEQQYQEVCGTRSSADMALCEQLRQSIDQVRASERSAGSWRTARPTPTPAGPTPATFLALPPDVGSDAQRNFYASTCEGKSFQPGSSMATSCRENYDIITGRKSDPNVQVGRPSPSSQSSKSVDAAARNGPPLPSRAAGSCGIEDLRTADNRACIQFLGEKTEDYHYGGAYLVRNYNNVCNIVIVIHARTDVGAHITTGIYPGGSGHLTCQTRGGSQKNCSSFTEEWVSGGNCR